MGEEKNNNAFREDSLEDAIIELFKQQGYVYEKAIELNRQKSDIILADDLKSFLKRKYRDNNLTENELNRIISVLVNCGSHVSLIENSRDAYKLVTGGLDFNRDDETLETIHIDFMDFDNVENNAFKIVNQLDVENAGETKRPDVVIFINGIPVSIWEFKTTLREDKTIYDAYKQITVRYNRAIDNLTRYCFLSVISDGSNTRLGTVFTPYEYYYAWNKVNDSEPLARGGYASLESMVRGAFSKERILEILHYFVFYPEGAKDETPIVCRYPQFFAAEKMKQNIKKNLRPYGEGKGGTYFGATGCGKTYAMLFLCKLLNKTNVDVFNNPTILIIEDRDDLDTQTYNIFQTAKEYLGGGDVISFTSRKTLHDTLENHPGGGVYITTIQKFCENTGLLSKRNNIICISDEAHRTQTNLRAKTKIKEERLITTQTFAIILRKSLPNATYCGFTGTPIDKTIEVFGEVADRYTMKQSVDDGITVDISYEARLAKVIDNEESIKKIDEYYEECLKAGSREDQVEKSKRLMSSISAIYRNHDVLEKLAKDIVKHYEKICNEKPRVTQKAMIVCVDRQLAHELYKEIVKLKPEWVEKKKCENENEYTKKELKELKAVPKINLVMTTTENDVADLKNLCGNNAYRKELATSFKDPKSNFKIAIVVDMWITGFDVKPLKVMYLIKPVQDHQLIQTISRVNRVFEGKGNGIVVDYMKLYERTKDALRKYGGAAEDQLGEPVEDSGYYTELLKAVLNQVNEQMKDFDSSAYFDKKSGSLERYKCIDKASEYVQRTKSTEDDFLGSVKKLKSLYETIIASDEITEDEIGKTEFYIVVRSYIMKQTKDDSPDYEKMNIEVEKMLNEAIKCSSVGNIFEEYPKKELFSDEMIEEIKNVEDSSAKVNGLIKLANLEISDYEKLNVIKSREFSEMLRNTIDKYNARSIEKSSLNPTTTIRKEVSNEILDILDKIKKDKQEFEKLGITQEEKVYYDIIKDKKKRYGLKISEVDCIELSKSIRTIINAQTIYTDWYLNGDIIKTITRDITLELEKFDFTTEMRDDFCKDIFDQLQKIDLDENN